MKEKLKLKKILYWVPRILAILVAILIGIFSCLLLYEVLYQELYYGDFSWMIIIAVLTHLIPPFIIVAALLIAWKWEIVGGIIFILLGLYIILMSWGTPLTGLFPYILIFSGCSLFLAGILFLLSKFKK